MPSYTKNDIHVDDTINYEELNDSLKSINDIEYLRKKVVDFFKNNEKKSNNIDKLIEQKEEEKKKLNNDIQQLKKEKCQLFNIERSIIDIQKEYKLNFANVRKNNEELSKNHIMYINDYSTPKIHLITQGNLIKDEDGYCVEDIVSANELNIKVSFGDIIDTTGYRHYSYSFVDENLNLINTQRKDALDQEYCVTLPLEISRYFRDTLKKYKSIEEKTCILAYELPYWDKTVKTYQVPRNSNYLYTYYFDYDLYEWILKAEPIYQSTNLKVYPNAKLRENMEFINFDNLEDSSDEDYNNTNNGY
jgi:hypothetical protein